MVSLIVGEAKTQGEYEVFSDWIASYAISIRNAGTGEGMQGDSSPWKTAWEKREEEFQRIMKKHDIDVFRELNELLVAELQRFPRDVLGEVFMEGGFGTKSNGQYFTPPGVQSLTARLTISADKIDAFKQQPERKIRLYEPSIGSGGMIIESCNVIRDAGVPNWQRRIQIIGQDIEWRCVYMSYIQLSLLGLDATIYQGDTLADPGTPDFPPQRIWRTPRNAGLLI